MTASALVKRAESLMKDRAKIPEAKCGEYSVVHELKPAGSRLLVSSQRDAIFAGIPACELNIRRKTIIHQLRGPSGTWMSDLPCELLQMNALACEAKGNVLVGGLGLGVLPRILAKKRAVKSVTVVEISPDVINLCGPSLPDRVRVIQEDINIYCAHSVKRREYNWALLDTWQGTGEYEFSG